MSDLHHISGLFVGQLSDAEMVEFNEAVREGRARRSYEGAMGFLGCPVVRLMDPDFENECRDYKLHAHDYL
jgi:hypothetical protein